MYGLILITHHNYVTGINSLVTCKTWFLRFQNVYHFNFKKSNKYAIFWPSQMLKYMVIEFYFCRCQLRIGRQSSCCFIRWQALKAGVKGNTDIGLCPPIGKSPDKGPTNTIFVGWGGPYHVRDGSMPKDQPNQFTKRQILQTSSLVFIFSSFTNVDFETSTPIGKITNKLLSIIYYFSFFLMSISF